MLATEGQYKVFNAPVSGYKHKRESGSNMLMCLCFAAIAFGSLCGTGINQDGRSASLTAPNGPSQQEVILASCRQAVVQAHHFEICECHGTGTALGDPIEVGALIQVLGAAQPDHTFNLASAKTNVGHLEMAAGSLGIIKAILLLSKAGVPPNQHLRRNNPHFDEDCCGVHMPSECNSQKSAQFVGVSSFGFGGTNAHSLLSRGRPATPTPPTGARMLAAF
jgi:acyl transferase domain-containing protein